MPKKDTDPTDRPKDKDPDPPDPDDDPWDPNRARETLRKKNSENAQLRQRLKDAEAKASRLDELEEAEKDETQKLRDQLAETNRKAQEADVRAMRAEIAADKGLTASQAKRLVGSTLEELEADADALIAEFKPPEGDDGDSQEEDPPPPGKPKEHFTSGGKPDKEPDIDIDKLVESIELP